MNVQPKPSPHQMPAGREATGVSQPPVQRVPLAERRRVPVAGPRLLFTWPVEFEVEPWRP